MKHIGDFLHSLPALGFLKKHAPERGAALVLPPALVSLAQAHPWVDKVHILDRRAGGLHLIKTTREINAAGYQCALIFDGQSRSILSAALAGIPRRLGSAALGSGRFKKLYSNFFTDSSSNLESQAYRGQKLAAAALGLEAGEALRPPAPVLTGEVWQRVGCLLDELPGSGPLVALTLQGRQCEKTWPLREFAALARKLFHQCQARLFVSGGAAESPLAQALAQAAQVPIGNFCGRTDLLDLVALADSSDLFISVDTGSAHLAALTQTPLISIYIWTSPALWPPQSPRARLLVYHWALKRFGLSPDSGPWLSAPGFTADQVFKEAEALLKIGKKL